MLMTLVLKTYSCWIIRLSKSKMFPETIKKSGQPFNRSSSYPPTTDVSVAGAHCFLPSSRFSSKLKDIYYISFPWVFLYLNNKMWNYSALFLEIIIFSQLPLMFQKNLALKWGLKWFTSCSIFLCFKLNVYLYYNSKEIQKKEYMFIVDLLEWSEKFQAKNRKH